ncbi:hypothetical protein H6776_02770 [Candidatus Nomurabacteria bacterium]|nr:hypothetical protein [Candidatus Nomurabacteria bacterium]
MELFTQIKPIVVIIHAFAGAIGIGATTVTDTLFFKFLADLKISSGEKKIMDTLSQVLWVALGFLIVTGVLLFLSDPARYGASPKFLVKMVIVGIITLNGLLLNYIIAPRMESLRFDTPDEARRLSSFKRIAFISGVVSLTSWYASFLLGLLVHIPLTFWQGIAVYLGFLLVGGILSQIVYRLFVKKSLQK